MAYSYPMMLDLTGRLAVIVGGGKVAVRKARGLLSAGAARVRVVAPEIDAEMPAGVERVRERYHDHHLEGAGLVFAATSSAQVNEAVVADARRRGILVNRADADEQRPGDFATPAIWRQGEMVITVSAGGSAALAAKIRDQVGAATDGRWAQLVQAMQRLRPIIRARKDLTQAQRAEVFRTLASEDAVEILTREGEDGLLRWTIERTVEAARGDSR